MKIIIKTKNLELSDSLQKFIEDKIESLEKFVDFLKHDGEIGKTLDEVFVEVEKETKHHKKGQIFGCQLEINLPGKNLVVKSDSDDLYKAIVDAKRDLEQGIKKYKLKKVEKNRRERKKSKTEIDL